MDKVKLAVIGTPGIGKPLFLLYLMVHLKKRGTKRVILVRPLAESVYIFETLPDGRFVAAVVPLGVYNNSRWRVPLGSGHLHQQEEQCPDNEEGTRPSIPELIMLFSEHGGVARCLFGGGVEPLSSKLDGVVGAFKDIAYLDQTIGDVTDLSSMDGVHLVLHLKVSDAPEYQQPIVCWASELAEKKVMLKRNDNLIVARSNFVREAKDKPGLSTARGQSFEPLAHDRIQAGGTFAIKRLGAGGEGSHHPAPSGQTLP